MNSLKLISIATTITLGAATMVITGTTGFAPASASKADEGRLVALRMSAPVAVVASPETPQEQVWDMTYGPERNPQ